MVMMPTTTPTRARVIDQTTEYRVRRWRAPEQGLPGALAGLEGAAVSLLAVVVPVIAAYIAAAAAPSLGQLAWTDAAALGSRLWLLGHGVPLELGESGTVSVIPLGIAGLTVLTHASAVSRARLLTASGQVIAFVTGLAVLAIVVLATSSAPGVRGIVGAVVVFGAATLLGGFRARRRARVSTARRPGRRPSSSRAGRLRVLWSRTSVLEEPVRRAARASAWALAALLAFAAVLTVAVLAAGAQNIRAVHTALAPNGIDAMLLGVSQLVLLPTLLVWALAWLAGPGFAVGVGAVIAPTGVTAGALPAIPVLAALPAPEAAAATPGLAVVFVFVVAGGLAGWRLTRSGGQSWRASVIACLTVGLIAGAVTWLLAAASSGAVGPLAPVGPVAPLLTAVVAGGLSAAGAGAVVGAADVWRSRQTLRER